MTLIVEYDKKQAIVTLFLENPKLLQFFRQGKPDALTAVYRHYINDLERFFHKGFFNASTQTHVIGFQNREIHRELIQDIFIKAFAPPARENYDGLRPYKSYILTIAKNTAIDYARKHPTDALAYLSTEYDESVNIYDAKSNPATPTPEEDSIHWKTCASAADAYVQTLNIPLQTFVQLRFEQELPQRDIAKTMNISRWKVRAYEKKVIGGLRKHLRYKGLSE